MDNLINNNISQVEIIGLGEVGGSTFNDMYEVNKFHKEFIDDVPNLIGVENNEKRLKEFSDKYPDAKFSRVSTNKSDIYIISIYNDTDIYDLVEQILSNSYYPLIVIESTIKLETLRKIQELRKEADFSLAVFPHRYNPNDEEHRVFNLDRVVGFNDEQSKRSFMSFYLGYMNEDLLHEVPIEIAVLSKVAENTYRFVEIALAEELKLICDKHNISFNKLRKSMNTKWNIDLKEARDGIGGRCLPKDTHFFVKMFPESELIKQAIEVDNKYKKKYSK